MQGEVSDEDDELGKCTTDLSTRALKQVFREPVGVSKQNVVCKPVAYILTVSQQDAEGVVPRRRHKENIYREGRKRETLTITEVDEAYQSLAGPLTTFLV